MVKQQVAQAKDLAGGPITIGKEEFELFRTKAKEYHE